MKWLFAYLMFRSMARKAGDRICPTKVTLTDPKTGKSITFEKVGEDKKEG